MRLLNRNEKWLLGGIVTDTNQSTNQIHIKASFIHPTSPAIAVLRGTRQMHNLSFEALRSRRSRSCPTKHCNSRRSGNDEHRWGKELGNGTFVSSTRLQGCSAYEDYFPLSLFIIVHLWMIHKKNIDKTQNC
jgi:hypothetical protein